jgi:putative flippase GtrA
MKMWLNGKSQSVKSNFSQFVKFGLVGLSNTIISYLINIAVLILLRNAELKFDYVIANLVAFFLSVLWSYHWNSRFVFKLREGEQRSTAHTLLKTYLSYAVTGIVLCNVLSWFWIEFCGISKFTAPIINLIVSVPVNYLLNKYWAFRGKT